MNTYEVLGTVTTAGDTAVASVDGATYVAAVPVSLQHVEGTWKLTRCGVCAILATGSPCPEPGRSGPNPVLRPASGKQSS